MDILVIGNSDTNLRYPIGGLIDKFDKVFRINNFVIEGYEKYVGSKITDVFLSQSWWHIVPTLPKGTFLHTNLKHIAQKYGKMYHPHYPIIVNSCNPESNNETKIATSSGIVLIKILRKMYPKDNIFIHGICDGGSGHYWEQFEVSKIHNLEHDLTILKKINGVMRLVSNV